MSFVSSMASVVPIRRPTVCGYNASDGARETACCLEMLKVLPVSRMRDDGTSDGWITCTRKYPFSELENREKFCRYGSAASTSSGRLSSGWGFFPV